MCSKGAFIMNILNNRQYKNMSDILFSFGPTHHFLTRVRINFILLQIINNQALISQIFCFLKVHDILSFSASSSQSRKILQIQSIQLRIIKKKLELYEKPKVYNHFDSLLQYFPNRIPEDATATKKDEQGFNEHHSVLQLKKLQQFYSYLKGQMTFENKFSDQRFSRKKQQISQNSIQTKLNQKMNNQQKPGKCPYGHGSYSIYKKTQQKINPTYTKNYRSVNKNMDATNKPEIPERYGKKLKQYNPSIAQLSRIQYQHAKKDYQKRKSIREQLKRKVDMSLKIMDSNLTKQPSTQQILLGQQESQRLRLVNELQHLKDINSKHNTQILGKQEAPKAIFVLKSFFNDKVYSKLKIFMRHE